HRGSPWEQGIGGRRDGRYRRGGAGRAGETNDGLMCSTGTMMPPPRPGSFSSSDGYGNHRTNEVQMNSAGPAERNRPNRDGVWGGLVHREGRDVELLVAPAVAIPDLHRQTGRGAPGIFVHATIGLDVLEDE